MAHRIATQAGNANDTATWGGAAAPVDGDTFSTGNFKVTVTANLTVGDSASNTTITGTVASTAANALVGTGTLFTTELKVGDLIAINHSPIRYGVVSVITDNLNLNVIANFAGSTTAGETITKYSSSVIVADGASAQLEISANITLTVKGNVLATSHASRINPIVIKAGTGGIQFDDSGNVGQSYCLQLGSKDAVACVLLADGVDASNLACVKTKAGNTGRAQLTGRGWTGSCGMDARFTTFKDMGGLVSTATASNAHSSPWAAPTASSIAAFVFRLTSCEIDGCSQFANLNTSSATAVIDLYGSMWKNSVCPIVMFNTGASTGTVTTGTRRCQNNTFDKTPDLQPFAKGNYTISGNKFFDGVNGVVGLQIGGEVSAVEDNFILTNWGSNNHVSGATGLTNLIGNYMIMSTPGCGIARFPVGQSNTAGTQDVNENVIECTAYNFEGVPEGAKPTPGTALVRTNLLHNLYPRPAYDIHHQYAVSDPSSMNNEIYVEHTTLICVQPSISGTSGMIQHVATNDADARFKNCINNIIHCADVSGAGDAYIVSFNATNNTSNATNLLLSPATCHNNVGYQLSAGLGLKGYNFTGDGTAPGTSDVQDLDSAFVDLTRNFLTWSAHASGLNQSAAQGAFNAATAYSVGDVVSRALAGFCNGATVNYRCVKAHTPTSVGAESYPGSKGGTWTISSLTSGTPMQLNLSSAVGSPVSGTGTLATGDWVSVCRTTDAQLRGRFQIASAAASAVTLTGTLASGITGAGNQFLLKCWQAYWEPESEYEMRRNAYQDSGYNVNATFANLRAFTRGGHVPVNILAKIADDSVTPSFGWAGALEGTSTVTTASMNAYLISVVGQVQTVNASAGVPAGSVINGGTAFDATGRMCLHNLSASAVPGTAVWVNGLAHHPDGRVYVTTDTPSGSALISGMAVRVDGALHVSTSAVVATDVVTNGIAKTSAGVVRVSTVT